MESCSVMMYKKEPTKVQGVCWKSTGETNTAKGVMFTEPFMLGRRESAIGLLHSQAHRNPRDAPIPTSGDRWVFFHR